MAPHPRFQYGPFMNTTFTSHEPSHSSTSTEAFSTTTLHRTYTAAPSVQTFTSTAPDSTSTSRSMTKLPLPTTTFMVWEFYTTTVTSEPAPTSTGLSTSSVYDSTVSSTVSIGSSMVTSSLLPSETSTSLPSSALTETSTSDTSSADSSTITSSSLSPDIFFTFQNKVVAISSLSSSSSTASTTTTVVTDSILSTLPLSTSTSATPSKMPFSPILLLTAPSTSSSSSTTLSSTTSLPSLSTTTTPALFDYDFTPPSTTLSATVLGSPSPEIPTITSRPANSAALTAAHNSAAAAAETSAPAVPQNKTPAIVAAAAVPIIAFIFLVSIFMLWFTRQAKRRAMKEKADRKLEEANGGRDLKYVEGEGKSGSRSVTFGDGRKGKGVDRDSTLAAIDGEGGGPEGEMRGRLGMGRVRASEDESLTEARRHYYQRFSKRFSAAVVRF